MELPSKFLEQIALNTRFKIQEHVLVVMDKSTFKEHLYQPLQTIRKQFKIANTFLTGYNGNFNATDRNNKFYFVKTITDKDGFIQIILPPGAYEVEKLNNEIESIIIDEEQYTEVFYPFLSKPNFSTLGYIIEISTQKPTITFELDDSMRDLLGFNETTVYEEYNLSPIPVDILSFDNIFLECNIA